MSPTSRARAGLRGVRVKLVRHGLQRLHHDLARDAGQARLTSTIGPGLAEELAAAAPWNSMPISSRIRSDASWIASTWSSSSSSRGRNALRGGEPPNAGGRRRAPRRSARSVRVLRVNLAPARQYTTQVASSGDDQILRFGGDGPHLSPWASAPPRRGSGRIRWRRSSPRCEQSRPRWTRRPNRSRRLRSAHRCVPVRGR